MERFVQSEQVREKVCSVAAAIEHGPKYWRVLNQDDARRGAEAFLAINGVLVPKDLAGSEARIVRGGKTIRVISPLQEGFVPTDPVTVSIGIEAYAETCKGYVAGTRIPLSGYIATGRKDREVAARDLRFYERAPRLEPDLAEAWRCIQLATALTPDELAIHDLLPGQLNAPWRSEAEGKSSDLAFDVLDGVLAIGPPETQCTITLQLAERTVTVSATTDRLQFLPEPMRLWEDPSTWRRIKHELPRSASASYSPSGADFLPFPTNPDSGVEFGRANPKLKVAVDRDDVQVLPFGVSITPDGMFQNR